MSTLLRHSVFAAMVILIGLACGGGSKSSNPPAPPPVAAPTVSGINPATGAVGTPVTITGTNFSGATAVLFNSISTTAFVVASATQITTTVPAGATSGKVSVTTPGGTASSAATFSVTTGPAPTLSSVAPASGPLGTAVTLTGTHFTGATAVAFNGASAVFTVVSDTQINTTAPGAASTGLVSVTTPAGTATSPSAFTVTTGTAPTLTSVSPATGPVGTPITLTGSNLLGASSVTFNGVSGGLTIRSATQISTLVPAGATTGAVQVTTPGGTATSSAPFTVTAAASLDLSIAAMEITQATQTLNNTVPLVKDRRGTVRVFVVADRANTATPKVRVRFTTGATVNELIIPAPGTSVPTTLQEGTAAASWNGAVPASWIQPGLTVTAEVDYDFQVAESNETNNVFPADGLPWYPEIRTQNALTIKFIPVTTGDGRTGAIDATSQATFLDMARRIHPLPEVINGSIGSTWTSSTTLSSSDSSTWGTVLSEVSAKRAADGASASTYYFGVVNPNYGGGIAGIGYMPGHASLGWDKLGSAGGVLAHEIGHNFSRPHSPCGVSGDAAYPYPGGKIGVTGWDAFAASGNLKDATVYTDVMGYCGTQWISDYCYLKILEYRSSNPNSIREGADADSDPAPKEDGLLIWGRIEGERVILEPALRVWARPSPVEPGPWTLEGHDGKGVVLRQTFSASPVADLEGDVSHFAFVVPARTFNPETLQELHLLKEGRERARRVAPAPGSPEARLRALAQVKARRTQEFISLSWDPEVEPMVAVRDADTGELLGFHRSGQAAVPTEGRRVEFLALDGVHTRVLPSTPD